MDFVFNLHDRRDDAEDVLLCLRTLYATREGSIPGNRSFGLSFAGMDEIPVDAEELYALEIMEKTDQFEPRVAVTEVAFDRSSAADGKLKAVITIEGRQQNGR